MSRFRNSMIVCFLLSCIASLPVAAQDWAQWRGPGRDGVVKDFSIPANWPKGLKLVWKTPVGAGFSSPVVSQGKAYTFTRKDEQEVASALDMKTGKVLWTKSYAVPFTKNQYAVNLTSGPRSTPVVHNGRLYTLGVTGVLSCFDVRNGELKWRKDFSSYADTSKMFTGAAMSPVIEGRLLIAHVGDDRKGWVIGFDLETGQEKWRWEGDGPGYASPVVVNIEGTRQAITLTDKSAIGIATDSGKLLWSMPFPDEWNENIITPVIYQNSIILSGVRKGTLAIKVIKQGDKWTTQQLWHNKDVTMYMSSPVLVGDLLFGLSNKRKGQFFCLDPKTGSVLWTTEGREGDNASVLTSGGLIFLLTTDANLTVAKSSDKKLESIARYSVADSSTWAHPVFIGRQILVKDDSNLALWSLE
jgi:outer membrane protein assembly factor BamB